VSPLRRLEAVARTKAMKLSRCTISKRELRRKHEIVADTEVDS